MNKTYIFTILAVLLFWFQSVYGDFEKRDVCIIGGGISGMSAAVYLKDIGYNPIVLEKERILGGCCNTVYFPAAPGQQNWIDVGVIALFNTTALNAMGLGPYVDVVGFIQRFVDELIPLSIPDNLPQFFADLKKGVVVNPTPVNQTAFAIALQTLFTYLAPYPWLNTLINKPDPIPAEMLISLSDFIVAYKLEPLIPLIHAFINAATTNFSQVSAFDGFRLGLNQVGITTVINSATTFSIKGGCYSLYKGMSHYLSDSNTVTSANIVSVKRPSSGNSGPVLIEGHIKESHNIPFKYECDSLIVAIPPTPDNTGFIDLDIAERSVLGKSRHLQYYVSAVDVAGPIAESDFDFINYDTEQPFGLPVAPAPIEIFRGISYGPASLSITSATPVPTDELVHQISDQMKNIPASQLTSVAIDRKIYYHQYSPYFPPEYLGTSPNAFTQLDDLQGYRNTYYTSSLSTMAAHANIINFNSGFIKSEFPVK